MCMPQVRGVLLGIGCSYTKIAECKKLVGDDSNIIWRQEKDHYLGWKCLSRCKAKILETRFLYCWGEQVAWRRKRMQLQHYE